jgi:hypothetical protein
MNALERLRNSNAWNDDWALPIGHSGNPHLYVAYCDLVLRLQGEEVPRHWYWKFYDACEVEPGLFKRWPDGRFGPTSHDEVIGAAHMGPYAADRILRYLDEHGGEYNSHGVPAKPLRYNLYRLPWLRGYLCAAAGYRMSPLDQVLWSLKLLLEARSDSDSGKTGPGPRLRAWLMSYHARKHAICALAWRCYRWQIQRKGCTLKHDLEQEPAWPVLSELAPNKYEHLA